jgi:hypothetical protein
LDFAAGGLVCFEDDGDGCAWHYLAGIWNCWHDWFVDFLADLRLGVVVVERYEFSDKLEEIVDRCLMVMFDRMSCEGGLITGTIACFEVAWPRSDHASLSDTFTLTFHVLFLGYIYSDADTVIPNTYPTVATSPNPILLSPIPTTCRGYPHQHRHRNASDQPIRRISHSGHVSGIFPPSRVFLSARKKNSTTRRLSRIEFCFPKS